MLPVEKAVETTADLVAEHNFPVQCAEVARPVDNVNAKNELEVKEDNNFRICLETTYKADPELTGPKATDNTKQVDLEVKEYETDKITPRTHP